MAGIYIHIPFCIQKCGYCDFYSLVRLTDKSDFVSALCKEIRERKNELNGEAIQTIYFGGGTPSLLQKKDFEKIINTLSINYDLSKLEEFTVEVNPDDINKEYVEDLSELGFNRLSLGVQSFNDRILAFMNRRHNAEEAVQAVQLSQNSGFDNISIDLIYGIPDMSAEEWENSIDKSLSLHVQHISAYHLTFEPGTVFYKKLKKNRIKEVDDKISAEQYSKLIHKLEKGGFQDYEISNFCKPGFESKHNSSYWSGSSYLGFGPSAHSYSGTTRRWNISDLKEYIGRVQNDEICYEEETLSEKDIYNETIMLGLRTNKGVDLNSIYKMNTRFVDLFKETKSKNIILKNTFEQDGYLKMCKDKKILTDRIISDFFMA
ncbi:MULTISPECIES: radical SAM family heme chaperone HemW [unclassified Saccharicrinis]|uniref:radical SAM family heme chaperone HemW n=1 Tax=unclassified Saccharicrinis TaxID=2646859 RepID=UPI003D342576